MPETPDQYMARFDSIDAALKQIMGAVAVTAPPGGVTPSPSGPAPGWWKPTAAQTVAFAAKVKLPLMAVLGWDGTTEGGNATAQAKAPALDQGNVSGAREYASFGYRPDGTHYLWTQEWLAGQRAFADQISKAPSPGAAEALCTNAKFVAPDDVNYQIMVGLTQAAKFTPFMTPACRIETTDQTVAYLQLAATPGGPGPSGG